jgi:hypothetical protein
MKEQQTLNTHEPANGVYGVLTAGNCKPILFSTPMVQAILRDEKTQTRRIMQEQPPCQLLSCGTSGRYWADNPEDLRAKYFRCKYEIGDILWVRETWHPKRHNMPTGWKYEYKATAKEDGNPTDEPWKPSIFMPKDACRIFLKITKIKIERLQDITDSDIVKEGAAAFGCCTKQLNWQILWEKINGFESWKENPWVFVYEFERTDASFACR